MSCSRDCGRRAVLKRPKTGEFSCKDCFFAAFEREIHETIVSDKLFAAGDRVVIGASGGKDSTVLAFVLSTLNRRHNYGLDLRLLAIDEGIAGYRDDSLMTVKKNEAAYGIPLTILSYKDLYGWTMDEIVETIGNKHNCTFCGVFRRQALDRGAMLLNATCVATGHNADDIAETVVMNVLRGDFSRLQRCVAAFSEADSFLKRVKPLKLCFEKEIVLYAYHKKLEYFSTECLYAPNAYRGFAREFIKDLECVRPSTIIDLIHSASTLHFVDPPIERAQMKMKCERCGHLSSQRRCRACSLLDGLNNGFVQLHEGRTASRRRANNKAVTSSP